jgi:hypothetical protein
MASQRCSLCGVNYPSGRSECIRCGGPLRPCDAAVSEDWANVDVVRAGSASMKVEMWRLHVLVEASYPVELAEKLAAAGDVDLPGGRAPRARLPRGNRGEDPALAG